jgi:hypothetical protein
MWTSPLKLESKLSLSEGPTYIPRFLESKVPRPKAIALEAQEVVPLMTKPISVVVSEEQRRRGLLGQRKGG